MDCKHAKPFILFAELLKPELNGTQTTLDETFTY